MAHLRLSTAIVLTGVTMALCLGGCRRSDDPAAVSDTPTDRQESVQTETPPAPSETLATMNSSLTLILLAILDLESANDAKCHSTACRFEDFLFGTPLNDAARSARFERQKELLLSLWARASRTAHEAGGQVVTATDLQPLLEQHFEVSEDALGRLDVRFADGSSVTLSAVRLRQYSSISYSLRAILSVQQDIRAGGGPALLNLSSNAVARLKEAIDTVSLCALLQADERARRTNAAVIDDTIMHAAWRTLIPEVGAVDRPSVTDTVYRRDRAIEVLDGIIEAKIAAYRRYNGVTHQEANNLFYANTRRFYARYPVPTTDPEGKLYRQSYLGALSAFAGELIAEADRHARDAERSAIRSADALAAVERFLPQSIDDFEDVHLFSNLDASDRMVLEAHDCDSYRDSGLHWQVIRPVLSGRPDIERIPDPFAIEIVAEGLSQYGVLLLRIAGAHADEQKAAEHVTIQDLAFARRRIRELADRHHATYPVWPTTSGIVSVGGTEVSGGGAYFTDVTDDSGVDYEHRSSLWMGEYRRSVTASPPTFSGGGIAAGDLNDDGHVDLLIVGGNGNTLYFGDGRGGFRVADNVDLTFTRSDGTRGEARQPIFADFDNDGRRDILITYANDAHRLYRNLGGGRFQDVTATAGLGGEDLIGGPVTVFDYDGDGLLDIYICYFGHYLQGALPTFHDSRNALPNRLHRNIGGLRFQDVSDASGTGDVGWAQAVSHVDFDRDGHQDIIIANDFGRNAFLRNRGDGTFEDLAADLGITKFYHSMSVGITDLNEDGFPDVYVSNIGTMVKDNKYVYPNENTPLNFDHDAMATMLIKEANMLYMSREVGGRLEGYLPSQDVQRGALATAWAWDAEFFDYDNDGDDDLFVVNGSNDYNMFARGTRDVAWYGDTADVFYVNRGGQLVNRSAESGADFVGNSRSVVFVDMDEDGDLDIIVTAFHGSARVLRNNSEALGNHWVMIRLVGDPQHGINLDAIGARLIVTPAETDRRILREITGGSGYLSMEPLEQHIGLGPASTATVRVVWPNGDEQVVRDLAANKRHIIRYGLEGR